MKKVSKIFFFLLLQLFFLASWRQPVNAQSIQLVGAHLVNNFTQEIFTAVRDRLNGVGADWVPITIMIDSSWAANADNVAGLIISCYNNKFYPILRVSTNGAIISPQQASAAARGISDGISRANRTFPDNRRPIVVVLNEVNLSREWGNQTPSASGYLAILREFVNRKGNYWVANSPLAASAPGAENYWRDLANASGGITVLNGLDVLAFNAYALTGCADNSSCGRLSWLWEIGILNGLGVDTNKPRILTEFGPDPTNVPANYYSEYETLLRNTVADFRGNNVLAVTPLVLNRCTQGEYGWIAASPDLSTIIFYDFAFQVLNDACVPSAEGLSSLDLPANGTTAWGSPLDNEDVPCEPLSLLPISGKYYEDAHWTRSFPGGGRSCLNLDEVKQDELVTYCSPGPLVTDVVHYFPSMTTDFSGSFSFRWSGTQIPFLGNSSFSAREFTEASQRMSLFLTDFLRGKVYYDWETVNILNSGQYRRILDESGPIRKVYPHAVLGDDRGEEALSANVMIGINRRKCFVLCRLFGVCNFSGISCEDYLDRQEPIHDYKVIDAALEIPWLNITTGSGPIRLSEFICGNGNFYLTIPQVRSLCIDAGYHLPYYPHSDQIFNNDSGNPWIRRFPLAAKDDVPAVIDLSFQSSVAHGEGLASPPSLGSIQSSPQIAQNGVYFYHTGASPNFINHMVTVAYIPYIQESMELSEWVGKPYTPWVLQNNNAWSARSAIDNLKLANSTSCNINDIVRGGEGDVLAGTSGNGNMEVGFRIDDQSNPEPDANGWPARATATNQNQGQVKTYMPFLNVLAKRTIGQAGVFKTLLPFNFNRQVEAAINRVSDGKINTWELPGYGPASYSYDNELGEMDLIHQWGCTDEDGDGQCDLDPLTGLPIPGLLGPDNRLAGSGSVNGTEARVYFPYIGAVDIFRNYLANAVAPAALSTIRTSPSSTTPSSPGGTGGTTGGTGTLNYTLPFRNSGDQLKSNYVEIALSFLNNMGWTSNLLQDEASRNLVINEAISHGFSPVFVLALWMEETGASHFVQTGVSQDALRCNPRVTKSLQQSLDCLFDNFSSYADFEAFMCRYSEGDFSPPCTFTLNPQFPGRMLEFYNRLAANEVP